mgnify:CR=1 FL=1
MDIKIFQGQSLIIARPCHAVATKLITTWFGTFLFKEEELVDKHIVDKSPGAIAAWISNIRKGKILDEEKRVSKKAGGEPLIVFENRQERLGAYLSVDPCDYSLVAQYSLDPSLLQEAHLILAEEIAYGERTAGRSIVNMARARDDLFKARELLNDRLTSWTEECYPGATTLNNWVALLSDGEINQSARDEGLDVTKFSPTDAERDFITSLARELQIMDNTILKNEKILTEEVLSIAPNTVRLVGPLLTGKLIMLANGLERLAISSSSKVQLLGAEKALFRHKKRGAKPPKHGVLLQHPYVHGANAKDRGKRARMLANKIVIAARADALTKSRLDDDFFKM